MVKYITREVTEEMNILIRSELEKYPSGIKNIIAVIGCDTELGMDGFKIIC